MKGVVVAFNIGSMVNNKEFSQSSLCEDAFCVLFLIGDQPLSARLGRLYTSMRHIGPPQ